jgi:tRNA1(Val) A37 N6-methylase TrmN6
VRTITSDLEGRLQLFYDGVACDSYEISNIFAFLFESAVERNRRKCTGQYFTPKTIAHQAVRLLDLRLGETILDPGCGTGIFPLAILQELSNSGRLCNCGSLTYMGIENDPILALSTAISLDWVDAPTNWRVLYANFLRVQHNNLREALAHDFSVNAIIANPPYVRYHKLGRRKEITNRLNLSMLSGLHSHFLAHSAELLGTGRMVFIIPMEMIESRYGSALLKRLQREFVIKSIVMYRDHKNRTWNIENLKQFSLEKHSKVRQAWTLAFFQHISNGNTEGRLSRIPKNKGKIAVSLGDIASVHRGISTGANDFFVLTDMEVEAMGLSNTDYVRMVMPTRIRKDELPTVFAIEDWNDLKEKGKRCWLLCLPSVSPDELPSSVKEYIRKGERNGIQLIPTCRDREPWYHIKISRTPVSDLVFTYMSRGYPKFIYNKARVYNLTNLLGIRISGPTRFSDRKMANFVEQLNTELEKWIDQEVVGRKYPGGLVKFEPGDLKNMPICEQSLVKSLGLVPLVSSS